MITDVICCQPSRSVFPPPLSPSTAACVNPVSIPTLHCPINNTCTIVELTGAAGTTTVSWTAHVAAGDDVIAGEEEKTCKRRQRSCTSFRHGRELSCFHGNRRRFSRCWRCRHSASFFSTCPEAG